MSEVKNAELLTPFRAWIDRHVTKPFAGYEDMCHPDGTPFTRAEQIRASRNQTFTVVETLLTERKLPEKHVWTFLQGIFEPKSTAKGTPPTLNQNR